MKIKEYCNRYGISRRTAYYYAQRGIININNGIVTIPEVLPDPINIIIEAEYPSEAINQLTAMYEGNLPKGFSKKSIYRKWHKRHKLNQFKVRIDKGKPRNKLLNKMKDTVINNFLQIYYKIGQPNCMFAVKRLQEIASKTEELYEIAAIPRITLYKFCRQYLIDNNLLQSWNYANRRGKFQQISITGAFTDDIEFMDWYAMDDRKADISGVLVWDEVKKEWKTKTVFYWIIIEMKTMMPIGWVIKPDALNSQDVINALNQAFLSYGLPKKGILFDNGIGYSAQVQYYITRIKQLYCGSGYFTSPFKPGPAYTPTYKANIERFNKLLKDEFDLNFRNYVGGKREEVRHSSLRLSPEQAEHTISEYIRMAEAYLTGDCINRKRHRIIGGKEMHITISELFEKLSDGFEFCKVEAKDLAWASLEYDKPRIFKGIIKLTHKGTVINYLPENVPYELIGKKVYVAYNRQDMSRIWIYSAENFGKIKRGDYISTAEAMNLIADKQATIFKANAELRKAAKAHKEAILNYIASTNNTINEALNSIITEDGKAISKRKELLRKLQTAEPGKERKIIESTIKNEPELTPADEDSGYSLTYTNKEEIE